MQRAFTGRRGRDVEIKKLGRTARGSRGDLILSPLLINGNRTNRFADAAGYRFTCRVLRINIRMRRFLSCRLFEGRD